jgi:hypothetical protein
MSSGIAGVFTGALATAALDVAVSSPVSGQRVGGLFNVLAAGVQRLVSPDVPAIPIRGTNAHPYQKAAGQTPATKGGAGGGSRSRFTYATQTRPRTPKQSRRTTTVNI